MSLTLKVIVASTRPGRVGRPVADWVQDAAARNGRFVVELVDLADVDLPLYDEPRHPRLHDYENEHTRRWSEIVNEADAYVFVMPEYNHGPTPSLVNALNYVYDEWTYKPAGLVSYGGISGGVRSAQAIKPMLNALKMVPLTEGVQIPQVAQHVEQGRFAAPEAAEKGAEAMLTELCRWAEALKPMRG